MIYLLYVQVQWIAESCLLFCHLWFGFYKQGINKLIYYFFVLCQQIVGERRCVTFEKKNYMFQNYNNQTDHTTSTYLFYISLNMTKIVMNKEWPKTDINA